MEWILSMTCLQMHRMMGCQSFIIIFNLLLRSHFLLLLGSFSCTHEGDPSWSHCDDALVERFRQRLVQQISLLLYYSKWKWKDVFSMYNAFQCERRRRRTVRWSGRFYFFNDLSARSRPSCVPSRAPSHVGS